MPTRCQYCQSSFNSLTRHLAQPIGDCHKAHRQSLLRASSNDHPSDRQYRHAIEQIIADQDVSSASESGASDGTDPPESGDDMPGTRRHAVNTTDDLAVRMGQLNLAPDPAPMVSFH
jgi:hypothetical protein